MNDTLFLVSLLAVGGMLAGAWVQRQAPARRRRAGLGVLALVLLPVGALVLAGALGSKTLGWLAGLGLMALLAVGLPLGAGVLAGFVVATLVRGRAAGAGTPATGAPAAPASDPTSAPPPVRPPRPMRAAQPSAVLVSPTAAAAAVVCPHLQALEQALRQAGLNVRRLAGGDLEVQAVLELDEPPALADGVRAEEPVRPDERGAPEQLARLYCPQCAASLWFIHPRRALASTPRFRPQ